MVRPDYQGGSILNLMRSLAAACGDASPPPYAPLRGFDAAGLAAARHIVLLVIDGLGYRHLLDARPQGALATHLHGPITSVFPSTTAAAITTFLTGLAPQQHALTGWHMYFSELDAIAAVLPLTLRGPGTIAAQPGELPQRLFGHASFFERIARPAFIVSPQHIARSAFNLYHAGRARILAYKTLGELFAHILALLREAPEPSYIYAYYPELDSLAHAHGIGSARAAAELAAIDEAFGAFLAAARGTGALVLATADHGFVDSPPERSIDLADHPRLAATLARPLCGERRVAYCYVKPDQREAFAACAREQLVQSATLYPSQALIDEGWFGPGTPDPRLAARIGDYALIMKKGWTLKDWVPGEERHTQIGVHGGVSEEEMVVPLVVARA
jgi:hypothetical protein